MATYSYDDLFLFTKVVEVGSFIGTAKLLKIGQSTVSRRMKELEGQLNITLFRQHNKGYELSEIGRALYDDIKNQKYNIDDLVRKHLKFRESPRGTIKVALPTVLSMDVIVPYIPDFLERYPEINLETCYHTTEVDLVRGGFDMAIINHIPNQQTQKIKHVFTAEYYLYCTTEYQEKYGIPKTPQELLQHTVTGIMREDYTIADKVELIHRTTGEVTIIDTPRRVAVNNVFVSLQMMYSNKIIVGTLNTLKLNHSVSTVRVLPDYIIGTVKYYMLKHPYQNNLITQLFCDFIEDLLNKAK